MKTILTLSIIWALPCAARARAAAAAVPNGQSPAAAAAVPNRQSQATDAAAPNGQSQAATGAAANGQSVRRAVALLDYVAGDYALAVGPTGQVLSPTEYVEQQAFVTEAIREVRADAGAQGEDLARRLEMLLSRIEARAAPAEVSSTARALRDEIAQRFKVALLPAAPPDLARGRALYAEGCAICHGSDGHAPPKEEHELSTQPPSFAVTAETEELAPQRIFSATTYGVPRTAMPGFEDALDDAQRWDLSYFVLSLSHEHPADVRRGLALARAALIPTGYREIATQSDAARRARLAAAGLSAKDQETALAALRAGPFVEDDTKSEGLAEVRRELSRALGQAKAGDREGARRTIISAYLDHFEPREPSLRARDAELVSQIERQFLALRSALEGPESRGGSSGGRTSGAGPSEGATSGGATSAGGPSGGGPPDPAAVVEKLDSLLEQADARGPGGALVAFVAALAIALREGVEAALLVAALLAILRKAGRHSDASAVHFGWLAALGLGAVTWWATGALLVGVSGRNRELLEGVIQLLTAALLLYASHWLLAAATAKRLVSFLSAHALRAASSVVVFGLAFVAIYREMFEVVLFFRGLLLESPGQGGAVALGALCGLGALVVLVVAFQKLGRRLRPRPLLLTCGVLLCGLSVFMVGNGIRALQEIGALPLTVWSGFEIRALGLYGTREGVLAQALVLAILVSSAVWTAVRSRLHERRAPAGAAGA